MSACRAFAALFSYPRAGVLALVDECLATVTADASAADLLAFRGEAERLGLARLEEAYTAAFDFDPDCSLSVGHATFGENARRSVFMCRLAGMYRDAGLPPADGELPDHLPAVLRYLDAGPPVPEKDDLLVDAVVPALAHLARALGRVNHPYAPVARALLAHLAPAAAEGDRRRTPA
jgi:nitrate reductase molybdenum cofactor assembly chaperone NarJ/NarW